MTCLFHSDFYDQEHNFNTHVEQEYHVTVFLKLIHRSRCLSQKFKQSKTKRFNVHHVSTTALKISKILWKWKSELKKLIGSLLLLFLLPRSALGS